MADTAATTTIDGVRSGGGGGLAAANRNRRPSQPKATALLSVLFGLAVLTLASSRLPVEWLMLQAPASPAQTIPVGFAGALSDAAASPGAARGAATAARLRLAALPDPAHRAEREAALTAAVADLRRALLGAPADAEIWERLAFAEYARHQPLEAARAWRMAIVTGTFNPSAMPRRLQSGFALWPFMDADGRESMNRFVWSFFAWGPGTVTELTARFGAAAIVRQGLAADPAVVADFDRRLAAFKKP